ncbi:hypothetical protein CRYUN_Cryun12cG0110500 [Craigia yunnanensis]
MLHLHRYVVTHNFRKDGISQSKWSNSSQAGHFYIAYGHELNRVSPEVPLQATTFFSTFYQLLTKPLEVVLAANLRCTRCQKRVADTISRIDDVESIVVHVLEKKVTVTRQAFSHGSSTKIAAIYNELSCKSSRISQPSSFVD